MSYHPNRMWCGVAEGDREREFEPTLREKEGEERKTTVNVTFSVHGLRWT